MTAQPSILLRAALACAALAAFAPCQKRSAEGLNDEQTARLEKAKAAMEKSGDGEREEWANLTPEERLARNVTNGASAYCRFVASCRPPKLLPGQSGVLYVTALLQGNAVLPSPAPIEVLPRTKSNPISLGSLAVQPADAGKLAQAYLGRPVYDNFAVFEVPVTMGPEAKIGEKHGVYLDLKFDLYDGNSAQPVGRFIDRVSTEIEVGAAPDPVVQGGVKKPAVQPAAATPQEPVEAAPPTERGDEVVTAREDQPVAVPAGAASATDVDPAPAWSTPPPTAETGDGLPLPLLLGGGALVVVILLLLLRKRG